MADVLQSRNVPKKAASTGRVFSVPGDSLGLTSGDVHALAGQVRSGFPFRLLVRFVKTSGLSIETISRVVEIPARTLLRRKASGKLTKPESERLLRLSLVFEKTVNLFEGDADAARAWLNRPSKALGGETPLLAVETEIGARQVEDLIGRLEHGVFT